MGMKSITVEISKLSLKPGDILAVHCGRILSMEQRKMMRKVLESIAPDGVKVAVVEADCTLMKIEVETHAK